MQLIPRNRVLNVAL